MCNAIEQAKIFQNKEIPLDRTTLTASDIECISLFLTLSSNKEWKILDLTFCYIQDKGLNILYHGLCHSNDVTIDELWLHGNHLTRQSSSLISDLTVKCKVKTLVLSVNHTIGEDQQLCSMLTNPSTELETLFIDHTNLSSRVAREFFTAVKENNKLSFLSISNNAITDDACDVITTALQRNSCLVELRLYNNPLSSKAIINIVQCLKANNTLGILWLPHCPKGIQENITSLQEVVNKNRERQGCQDKLEISYHN